MKDGEGRKPGAFRTGTKGKGKGANGLNGDGTQNGGLIGEILFE